jgi:hypothetical protein
MELHNSYVLQLPYWYYSPIMKPNTISMNVPFTEADLASHILQMCCPSTWWDQFNLHKKGGTPMDMHLLLLSLKAIERVCGQERFNASPKKKASHSEKKCTKDLVLKLQPESQRKLVPRNTVTFARSMGACTRQTILEMIAIGLRKREQKNPFLCH